MFGILPKKCLIVRDIKLLGSGKGRLDFHSPLQNWKDGSNRRESGSRLSPQLQHEGTVNAKQHSRLCLK